MSITVQRMSRCQIFRETKINISIIVCILQFAELVSGLGFHFSPRFTMNLRLHDGIKEQLRLVILAVR